MSSQTTVQPVGSNVRVTVHVRLRLSETGRKLPLPESPEHTLQILAPAPAQDPDLGPRWCCPRHPAKKPRPARLPSFHPAQAASGAQHDRRQLRVFGGTAADQRGILRSGRKDSRPLKTGCPPLLGQHSTLANLAVNSPELWRPRDSAGGEARRQRRLGCSADCRAGRARSQNALRAAAPL